MIRRAFPLVVETIGARLRPILGLSFVMNGLLLTGPLYMMLVYDRVLSSESLTTLVALTALVAVCYTLYGYVDGVRARILARLAILYEETRRGGAYHASLRAEGKGPGPGGLEDLGLVRKFIASPAAGALFDAPWAPIFLLALFALHWSMGLLALIGILVLAGAKYVSEMRAAGKPSARATAEAADTAPDGRGVAAMVKRDAATIAEIGAEGRLLGKWRDHAETAARAETESGDAASGFGAASKAFRMFLQSAMLGLGAYLVINGLLSPGAMIAGSILMGRGLQPIEQLVANYRLLFEASAADRRLLASAERAAAERSAPRAGARRAAPELESGRRRPPTASDLDDTLVEAPRAAGALAALEDSAPPLIEAASTPIDAVLSAPELKLEVRNLHYVPPGARQPALTKLRFELYPGEVLGVIGDTGAGKSLLGDILIGRRKPSLGAATFGGREMADIAPLLMGDHIGYLSQTPSFLPGTVAETISRFTVAEETNDVVDAALSVGLHQSLATLPNGYATDIDTALERLSAGQAQRLFLARTIYGAPELVVFDEPGNNLSDAGVRHFNEFLLPGLRELKSVSVVLTHTLKLAEAVDFILVLQEGRQVAFDERDKILAKFRPDRAGDASHGQRRRTLAPAAEARVQPGAPPPSAPSAPPPSPAAEAPRVAEEPPRKAARVRRRVARPAEAPPRPEPRAKSEPAAPAPPTPQAEPTLDPSPEADSRINWAADSPFARGAAPLTGPDGAPVEPPPSRRGAAAEPPAPVMYEGAEIHPPPPAAAALGAIAAPRDYDDVLERAARAMREAGLRGGPSGTDRAKSDKD